MGVGHYENFPVASLLLPKRLRAPVRAIYRFARTADDIADEGDASAATRLQQLADLAGQLDAIECGAPSEWPDLAAAVARHRLPIDLLRDLLSAFRQDVTVHRYPDYAELFDYCRRSANTIGRLLLVLFDRDEPELLRHSDAICTGLQLVNFWQDVAIDWKKGRLYLPRSELHRFGGDESMIEQERADGVWPDLLAAQTARAAALLRGGVPLAAALGGRIGLELRFVVAGGLRIAERIDAARGDVFRRRPTLRRRDWLLLALRAISGSLSTGHTAPTGKIGS
ncbi:MAG TPA: squalene synthase HpnC [Burkholderiaceae bacterium]|nr:squalene synthase HpnC [Burkholderiaceae bacterium]